MAKLYVIQKWYFSKPRRRNNYNEGFAKKLCFNMVNMPFNNPIPTRKNICMIYSVGVCKHFFNTYTSSYLKLIHVQFISYVLEAMFFLTEHGLSCIIM